MRLIPVIAAGLIAAATFVAPAQAQYRHGGHGGYHHGYRGHRGGYGWHGGGHGWHRRHARVACYWRYHHRVCRRVW